MKNYYYNNKRGSFHAVSKDTFFWINDQPYVKEESITDRVVYELNKNNPYVICVEFNRNEEAFNGADWEWWVLEGEHNSDVIAYRFRVQAKKMMQGRKDNRHLFHYANKHGFQIEALIKQAEEDKAFPFYALYTSYHELGTDNVYLFDKDSYVRNLCKKCKNGIFLLSAYDAYEDYFKRTEMKAAAANLISRSFPVSMIDIILGTYHRFYYNYENHYENVHKDIVYKHKIDYIVQDLFHMMSKMSENKHHFEEFPLSLKQIIKMKEIWDIEKGPNYIRNMGTQEYWGYWNSMVNQIESDKKDSLCGIGVIDCRRPAKTPD